MTQNLVKTSVAAADGDIAAIGTTSDADTTSTVIGRLKKLVALLAGGLPAALSSNGGLKVEQVVAGPTQPVSGTFWQATQPVSMATNTPDVTDRAGRLLGHVTVDSAPTTAVTGPLTDTELRATAVPVSLASMPATPVTDNGGSLTVDGTVELGATSLAALESITVVDGGSTISVDDGGGSITTDSAQLPAALAANGGLKVEGVAGGVAVPVSIAAAVPVTDNAGSLTVDDGGGSITIDGNVGITGTVTIDSELTTQDYDSGAGTVTTAVTGLVVPASGGPAAITGDAANGLDVDVTRLPALPTGANVIGALVANQSVNNAQVNGSAVVTSVTGVQDVMPRKRTGATGLSPNYYAGRITTKTTTTITAATAYVSELVIVCSAAGTSVTLVVQNKEGTPKILVPSFTLAVPTNGNPNVVMRFSEPILMTSGIDIVTAGTTMGTVDVYCTYWQ